MISTAEIFGEYETMVMFEDGTELECYTSDTLEEALKIHDELVTKYNNDIYEGSTITCPQKCGLFYYTRKGVDKV